MDDPLDDWFDDAECQDALLAAIVDAEQKAKQIPPPPTKPTSSALPTPPQSTVPPPLPTQPGTSRISGTPPQTQNMTTDTTPHGGQYLKTLPSTFT
ncbi:hypothetical protein IWQ62_000823, partial [Dispira parvispora]